MVSTAFRTFVISTLVLTLLAFIVVQFFVPPDPFTQLLYGGPLMPVAVVVAYLHAYRGSFDAIVARF